MSLISPPALRRRADRWFWMTIVAIGLLLSILRAGFGDVVNTRGFSQLTEFFRAAFNPALDTNILKTAAREGFTTVSFALLGTALALVIGIVGGVVLSEIGWEPITTRWSKKRRLSWRLIRALAAVPRSVHEVVWGLLLLNILGNNPWVAILAIGVPFGSVTAKVFSEILDETQNAAYRSLRSSGASRLGALWYGVLPDGAGDLLSYSFYRLECAIRSAAILGIIGAGGLGFQLQLSFFSLNYNEMWTFLYTLIMLSGLADLWSSAVRRRHAEADVTAASNRAVHTSPRIDRLLLGSSLAFATAIPITWLWLDLSLTSLWSTRTRNNFSSFISDALPPSFMGSIGDLVSASADSLSMAVLALAIAFGPAVLLAFVVSRPRKSGVLEKYHRSSSMLRFFVRIALLVLRAVPPPVWAFLALFVLFPGIWPGAVALGIYNLGVIGRLLAEIVENHDDSTAELLESQGVGRVARLAYGTGPEVSGKFLSIAFYRWEVAIRDTVVVGVVGAAGLGRVIDGQIVRFDYDGLSATILALIVVTIVADQLSAAMRRSFR